MPRDARSCDCAPRWSGGRRGNAVAVQAPRGALAPNLLYNRSGLKSKLTLELAAVSSSMAEQPVPTGTPAGVSVEPREMQASPVGTGGISPKSELQALRAKALAQEQSLHKYRIEAEQLIAGGVEGDTKANGMMKAWLRDAKKQSEELKALFEQSRVVAAESAAIARRDYDRKLARLKQDLDRCNEERAAAVAERQTTEDAMRNLRTQVTSACAQRDAARLELEEAVESHRVSCLQLEEEHHEEVAKMASANHQYQTLLRELSEKSAAQEKSTSEMFEHTLNDMKLMMERSRETREKERKTTAAMMESANQTAAAQKQELDALKAELAQVRGDLNAAKESADELQRCLAASEEELVDLTVASQRRLVHARATAYRKQRLERLWSIWSASAYSSKLDARHADAIRKRNEHIANTRGSHKLQRHRFELIQETFSSWKRFSRFMYRGILLRDKCQSRVGRWVLQAWMCFLEKKAALRGALDVREHRRARRLLKSAIVCLHDVACSFQSRRVTGMLMGDRAIVIFLHEFLLAWSCVAISTQGNETRACVLAGSLQRRGLLHLMAAWNAIVSKRLTLTQQECMLLRWRRRRATDRAFMHWIYQHRRVCHRRHLLSGFSQGRMARLRVGIILSWYERTKEAIDRFEQHKELLHSQKLLQQQKDVLTSEMATLSDKLRSNSDALNIAQKVNRVQENELAKMTEVKSEVQHIQELLSFSQMQFEAKEGDFQAARAQNAILQETIDALNGCVADLKERLEQAEAEPEKSPAQTQLEKEKSRSKMLEERLEDTLAQYEAMTVQNDELKRRVKELQVLSVQRSTASESTDDAASRTPKGIQEANLYMTFQEQVEKQAHAELEAKESEAAAMRAQISLLQTALDDANFELEQAIASQGLSAGGKGRATSCKTGDLRGKIDLYSSDEEASGRSLSSVGSPAAEIHAHFGRAGNHKLSVDDSSKNAEPRDLALSVSNGGDDRNGIGVPDSESRKPVTRFSRRREAVGVSSDASSSVNVQPQVPNAPVSPEQAEADDAEGVERTKAGRSAARRAKSRTAVYSDSD